MQGSLADGTLFAGRYQLLRRVATGGMGTVYEAVHVETNRRRAVKVMHPHLFQSPEMRERFKREARIAAQVESEHVVDVSDAGVDEQTDMPFLVMELLRGEDLGVRLKKVGRLPQAEALVYLRQTASALDCTHACSIVHRDLKPENLFLTQREDGSPRIKILDFGVAKLVAEGATGGATESLGTPLYMAPEQFLIGAKLTPTADVYALGMMTYTLLVGEPYWRHEAKNAPSTVAFALAASRGPTEPPVERAARLGVALPPAFDAWFARATAAEPSARFPAAGEAVQRLAEVLDLADAAPIVRPPLASSPGALPSAPPTPDTGLAAGSGTLERASTSTGAATWPVEPERRRIPAVGVAIAVAATALVGVGLVLALGGPSEMAGAPSGTAGAAPPVLTTAAPAAPPPVPSNEPAATATAAQTTTAAQTATAAQTTTASGAAKPPVVKPNSTGGRPPASPTGAAKPPPIFGRD
jgi:serine/threonine protein kinase